MPAPENGGIAMIIINFNQLAVTRACLDSLRRVTGTPFEVLVVDNGSTDGSADRLPAEYPEMHFIALGSNTGFTGGTNAGLDWCRERDYRAILLLNNDTVVEPDFLTKMAAHLEQERLVVPQIRFLDQPEVLAGYVGGFDWQRGTFIDYYRGTPAAGAREAPAKAVEMASACCLLIPSRVFEVVGRLDENFYLYYEDFDMIDRAVEAGFQLIYEPQAVIYHHESLSSGGAPLSPLRQYYSTRNRLYFMMKHHSAHLGFLAYFMLTRLTYSFRFIVGGRLDMLAAMWQGVRDCYAGRLGRNEAFSRSQSG